MVGHQDFIVLSQCDILVNIHNYLKIIPECALYKGTIVNARYTR